MNLRQLKEWINELLEDELGEYSVVFRRIKILNKKYWSAYDIPITASGIDDGNKELYLCDEESAKIMEKDEKEL